MPCHQKRCSHKSSAFPRKEWLKSFWTAKNETTPLSLTLPKTRRLTAKAPEQKPLKIGPNWTKRKPDPLPFPRCLQEGLSLLCAFGRRFFIWDAPKSKRYVECVSCLNNPWIVKMNSGIITTSNKAETMKVDTFYWHFSWGLFGA